MKFLQEIPSDTNVELVYTIKEAAKVIQVQPSTISKYCTELDRQGYEFAKKPDGTRKIREQEISIFRKIGELKSSSVTVEKAIETIVLAWRKEYSIDSIEHAATISTEQVFEMFSKLMKAVEKIDSRLSETEKKLDSIQANPEKLLLIESTQKELEFQRKSIHEIYEVTRGIQSSMNEQTITVQTTREFMERMGQNHSERSEVAKELITEELQKYREEVASSTEFMKDFRSQTERMLNTEFNSIRDTLQQEKPTQKNKKGWFRRLFEN